MTHFYNTYAEIPEDIKKFLQEHPLAFYYDEPKVKAWLDSLPEVRCGVHGVLPVSVGWYGARYQCLACMSADAEELAKAAAH